MGTGDCNAIQARNAITLTLTNYADLVGPGETAVAACNGMVGTLRSQCNPITAAAVGAMTLGQRRSTPYHRPTRRQRPR